MRAIAMTLAVLGVAAGCAPEYDIVADPEGVNDPLDTAAPLLDRPDDVGFDPTVDPGADPEIPGVEVDPPDTDEPPAAEEPVYANTSTSLFSVDPATGDATWIGDMLTAEGDPVENFVDIAIDLSGRIYGGTFDALYRIDPLTARVEHVCDLDVDMTALTFTSAGVLIAGGASTIQTVDVGSCAVQDLVVGSVYETSGDLVGLPDGYLYWTVWGETGDDLVRVDPDTGAQIYVGPIGVDRLFGLGYAEGQLYGFSADGETVRIPPGGGTSEITAISSTSAWWGATTNPVTW